MTAVDPRADDAPATALDREDAPAKINLALHVTGRRADGYHLLDTLVVHGGAHDEIVARAIPEGSEGSASAVPVVLRIEGPFAAGLAVEPDNLVLRAARRLAEEAARLGRTVDPVALTLIKRLPIASGIGGGSSDAAATLRLLDRVWGLGLGRARLAELALPLGADVPMCVWGVPLRARGIGELIDILPPLPPFRLVLVNPGVAVSTPAVFGALTRRDHPPLPEWSERFADVDALEETRNDLEAAAISRAPVIGDALAALRAEPGCRLARMSGSGATCFGLFARQDAAHAASRLTARRPDWWVGADDAA